MAQSCIDLKLWDLNSLFYHSLMHTIYQKSIIQQQMPLINPKRAYLPQNYFPCSKSANYLITSSLPSYSPVIFIQLNFICTFNAILTAICISTQHPSHTIFIENLAALMKLSFNANR